MVELSLGCAKGRAPIEVADFAQIPGFLRGRAISLPGPGRIDGSVPMESHGNPQEYFGCSSARVAKLLRFLRVCCTYLRAESRNKAHVVLEVLGGIARFNLQHTQFADELDQVVDLLVG